MVASSRRRPQCSHALCLLVEQGRQFPVQLMYVPEPVESYLDAVLRTVLQIHADEPEGDILAFVTGQDEIESLQRLIPER